MTGISSVRTQVSLWRWQRLSAMVLALAVCVHLFIIIFAVRQGLSAEAMLGRTRGSVVFAVFYGVFVLACAVHAPIGLLKIAEEWLDWRGRSVQLAALLLALWILGAGLRAVYAVVAT